MRQLGQRTSTGRALWLGLALGAASAGGCTTNHDALARRPPGSGGGGGGSGGSAGFSSGLDGSGDQAQGGKQNPDAEPPGDNVLTIVNGVVDAQSVRLCFARVTDDGLTTELVGSPLPELGYAASTALTEIDGLSLADDEIQPWVVAGDLSRIKKLDCEAAVALAQSEEAKVTPRSGDHLGAGGQGAGGQPGAGAGGQAEGGAGGAGEALEGGAPAAAGAGPAAVLEKPTLRARPLAALPAGTVDIGRSILMVLTGCMGGAAYSDDIDQSACGADYAPDAPTLQPIVVTLSRHLGIGQVGLQAVHASLPTGSVSVRASGDHGAVSLVFASGIDFGTIAPRPADTRFSPVDLGVTQSSYGLQAVNSSGDVLYQAAWADIMQASGLASIDAGRTYTAVLLGPDPLLIKPGFWNGSAFSLVDNDPTRK